MMSLAGPERVEGGRRLSEALEASRQNRIAKLNAE